MVITTSGVWDGLALVPGGIAPARAWTQHVFPSNPCVATERSMSNNGSVARLGREAMARGRSNRIKTGRFILRVKQTLRLLAITDSLSRVDCRGDPFREVEEVWNH